MLKNLDLLLVHVIGFFAFKESINLKITGITRNKKPSLFVIYLFIFFLCLGKDRTKNRNPGCVVSNKHTRE